MEQLKTWISMPCKREKCINVTLIWCCPKTFPRLSKYTYTLVKNMGTVFRISYFECLDEFVYIRFVICNGQI